MLIQIFKSIQKVPNLLYR